MLAGIVRSELTWGVGGEVEVMGDKRTCLLFEDGIEASNLVAFGVDKGALWLTGNDISVLLG